MARATAARGGSQARVLGVHGSSFLIMHGQPPLLSSTRWFDLQMSAIPTRRAATIAATVGKPRGFGTLGRVLPWLWRSSNMLHTCAPTVVREATPCTVSTLPCRTRRGLRRAQRVSIIAEVFERRRRSSAALTVRWGGKEGGGASRVNQHRSPF